MKLHYIASILIIAIFVLSVTASASMLIPANDRAKGKARAPEKSPVITENWELERADFIHYAKPPCNKNGVCEPELGENPSCPDCKGAGEEPQTQCYKLLGVKWKSLPVSYVINPANPDGLSEGFVTGAISASAETWDAATSAELFQDAYTVDYAARYGVQNFENAVVFGDHPDSNVIGVTTIWYTPRGRKIVEFDILLNTDFTWGDATSNPLVMDLQNIAAHELGHGVGLDDIYSDACSEVTMYGYSGYGETQKRTLEQPDMEGLQKLYGA